MVRRITAGWRKRPKFRGLLLAVVLVTALGSNSAAPDVRAEAESLYRVSEFPVRVIAGLQTNGVVSGKWAVWLDGDQASKQLAGRNLDTGLDFVITTGDFVNGRVDMAGDTIVTSESNADSKYGIFGYKLPDGQRFTVDPSEGGGGFTKGSPRISGNTVVWIEGPYTNTDVYGYDLVAKRLFSITSNPARQESPAVSGNYVVWLDKRNVQSSDSLSDIYGYDLAAGHEFRITSKPESIYQPAVSGNTVVWFVYRDSTYFLESYNIASQQESAIAKLSSIGSFGGPDIDGDLVVWSGRGDYDEDIFGYDLKQGRQFVVDRAIGNQTDPRISGKTVIWTDSRRSGVGKYEWDADIFGAKLEPGPAPLPPYVGVPTAVDAKIEIVWPHGGAPVTEADKANIGAWLFSSGTLNLAPCQWNPKVELWESLNNEPAKLVKSGLKEGGHFYYGNRAVPSWDFNDIDVSAARDAKNKLYFFVTIDGWPKRTNVWAHGADARTYFPQQDVPTGVGPVGGAVDAKIEIVWPHDNLPVDQAKQVNISAALFATGTLQSVPADWNPAVHLYRALNDGVGQEVGVGQKRLVQAGGLTHPVWDFNNVDVGAANDPVNKYYFTLDVDGVTTYSNVWSHGADARTYFPQVDAPTQDCRGS